MLFHVSMRLHIFSNSSISCIPPCALVVGFASFSEGTKMSSIMPETILWYLATCFALLAILSSVWIAFISLKYRSIIEQLEIQVLTLIDESIQIFTPIAVVNQIGMADIGNFEMNHESITKDPANVHKLKKLDTAQYAHELSRKLDDKDQLYKDFGDSKRSKPHVPDVRTALSVGLALNGRIQKPDMAQTVKSRKQFTRKSGSRETLLPPAQTVIKTGAPRYSPSSARCSANTESVPEKDPAVKPATAVAGTLGKRESATKIAVEPANNNNKIKTRKVPSAATASMAQKTQQL